MVRNFLSLSTLCVVLFLLGCIADNPLSPPANATNEETGSVAPQILYKATATQASVTVPASILPYVDRVRIRIKPSSGSLIERNLPFIAHSAAIDGIPTGAANLTVDVLDKYQFVIFSGQANVVITGGQTARPVVVADLVPAKKPLLEVNQVGNRGVRFSWPPCGLMGNVELYITVYNDTFSRWDTVTYLDCYAYDSDFVYNAISRKFEVLDTSTFYEAGKAYRFAAIPWIWDSRDSLWTKGTPSDWVDLTFSSGYQLAGYIYGSMTTETRISLYLRAGACPANLPPEAPEYTWLMKDNGDTTYFNFGTIQPGNYWVFAYDNFWVDANNWAQAPKKAKYTLTHDHNRTAIVFQLDFDSVRFTGNDTLSGYVQNASATGAEYYACLYFWSDSLGKSLYLGDYWAGTGGYFEFLNTPSMFQVADLYGITYNSSLDNLYLFLWSDEDLSNGLTVGDRYYSDIYSVAEYWIGDVYSSKQLGTISLNTTYTGAFKRAVPLKRAAAR